MRLIIAGTRTFSNYLLLKKEVTRFIINTSKKLDEVIILSGMAQGADKLGIKYAKEKNFEIEKHPALWGSYGLAAGPIRNKQMAEHATHCIVFWDGKSKGTANMIEQAKKKNLTLKIIHYE